MIYTLDEIKDGTGFDPAAPFITEGAPLSERAPEVGQLLADLRAQEAGNDGGWPGGDTVSILCEWFTANGYDIDAPLAAGDDDDRECAECGDRVAYLSSRDWCDGCEADPQGCDACGAEPGEECRPMCIGQAAQQDALGIDLTADAHVFSEEQDTVYPHLTQAHCSCGWSSGGYSKIARHFWDQHVSAAPQ